MYKRKGILLIECAIVLAIIAIVGAAAFKCADISGTVPTVKTNTAHHKAEYVVFKRGGRAVIEGYIITVEGKRYLAIDARPLVELAPATMTAELEAVK